MYRLDALLSLKIARHQILEHQNDVPEEGIRQAASERLLCPVEHKYKVRELCQSRIAPSGKGHDLMPVLLCVAHVVEDRLRLAALADGEHDRRLVIHRAAVRLLKEHIIVEMHIVERHKAADRQALRDIGPHNVGKALAGREHLSVAALPEQRAEALDQRIVVIVDQALEVFRLSVPRRGKLAAEVVIELAVAVKAQPLAHFDDAGRGQKVFICDLLDAHALLAPFDVRGNTGDHLALILREQIRQQKIIVSHDVFLSLAGFVHNINSYLYSGKSLLFYCTTYV